MDGPSSPLGNNFDNAVKGSKLEPEGQEIFVRAHTRARTNPAWERRHLPKWPPYCLIFDTETTIDPAQRLNFGVYRRCKFIRDKYVCIEEGIFHRDDLRKLEDKLLRRYKRKPSTAAAVEYFPAQTTLGLMSRASFVKNIFWNAIRDEELIIGFNLPFDLSRLAIKSTAGKKNDWSLALSSLWKNPKTGCVVPNPKRPRVVINAQNSKLAFIKLGSILHRDEWPSESRFLDLRTLGWALRNVSYNLRTACKAFGVAGKVDHKPSGKISKKEIDYCRGDVAASHRVLNAMMKEFNLNPVDLRPEKAYSPASIAKAYLNEMGIKRPHSHFKLSNKAFGIAMQSYYGGRAECRIRKTPVPVIHTDFTSQYPTVNALLGNWNALTSSKSRFVDFTTPVNRLLAKATIETTFDPDFWKQLSFFALVKPKGDILPVRTIYGGKTQNIGLNYLSSNEPLWYAGPDLVASKILTGRTPQVIKAYKFSVEGRQSGLRNVNLGGMVEVRPRLEDFYRKVIEQRISHKKTNPALASFLKVLANSGSYGLFVEVNVERKTKEKPVEYLSGEKRGIVDSNYTEKPGAWYFPPLASLITSGGRLLLAMLEQSVKNRNGSYLFCDTDSLCIVGTKHGGFVECTGGPIFREDKSGIHALSLNEIKEIGSDFRKLNPYDPSLVPEILKIEDVNFISSNPEKGFRQLFGYAISAKRYALYLRTGNKIQIQKASGHGLGYLFAPAQRAETEEDTEVPQWVMDAWDFLLRKELHLPAKEPAWLDLPAMMRMVVTTPNVFQQKRPEWLGPFNFFLFPLLSANFGGYPSGFDKSSFVFITSYESNRKKWSSLRGVNLVDGQPYQISMRPSFHQDKVLPESFRIVLRQYLDKEEVKSLDPDGGPCRPNTRGLLQRSHIDARQITPVGKETDRRWEQGEDPAMLDSDVFVYENRSKLVVGDISERTGWKTIGLRRLMRECKLSQAPISKAIDGTPVRVRTLATIRQTVSRILLESK